MNDTTRKLLVVMIYATSITVSLISASRAKVDEWFNFALDPSNSIIETRAVLQEIYPSGSPVVFFVEAQALDRARSVDRFLDGLEDVHRIASPFRVDTITADDYAVLIQPLDNGEPDLLDRVEQHPIYSELFVHGDWLSIWAWPDMENGAALRIVNSVRERFPDVVVFGEAETTSQMNAYLVREAVTLLSIAISIVLVLQCVFARSIPLGFVLTVITVAPGIWIAGLLNLFGLSVSILTIMGPTVTIMLSTTYVIHSYEYYVGKDANRSIHPAILAAAMTTLFGFATMTLSSIVEVRKLSLLLTCGVGLSFLNAQVLLPLLLRSHPVKRRQIAAPASMGRAGRMVSVILLACAALVAAPGIQSGGTSGYDVLPRTQLRQHLDRQAAMMGYSIEFLVDLNSEEEYGVVNIERYDRLVRTLDAIDSLPGVAQVISIVPLVNWVHGILSGSDTLKQPRTDVELGEALTFLPASDVGLGQLIDPQWSRHRIAIRVNLDFSGRTGYWTNVEALKNSISEVLEQLDQDWTIRWFGRPTFELEVAHALSDGLVRSIAVFLVAVVVFFLVIWGNVREACLATAPAVATLGFVLAFLRLTGIALSPSLAMGLITILGVSVDDGAILMSATRRGDRAPVEIVIQTTIILMAGGSSLVASGSIPMIEAGLVAITGFAFSTAFVLFVLNGWIDRRTT